MNRRESKALRQGGSLVVVLPRDWTRGHGVEAGDTLVVEYAEDVVVRPLTSSARGGKR